MAHALKRISYAACDPEYQQFSFLAREPKGRTDIQYCHAFRTQTSQEVSTIAQWFAVNLGLEIHSGQPEMIWSVGPVLWN